MRVGSGGSAARVGVMSASVCGSGLPRVSGSIIAQTDASAAGIEKTKKGRVGLTD